MGRLDDIARGMVRPINPYSMLILGVFTALWGLWLMCPHWDVFTTAPLFSKAAAFAPEWAWGTWSIICGVFIIIAGSRGYRKMLSYATAFAIWHWSAVAGMFWWGDWHNTGGLTYTFVAIYTSYAYLNFKVNFVNYDGHHRGSKF